MIEESVVRSKKMTGSTIQRVKLFVFLLIFLLSQIAACDEDSREKRQAAEPDVPLDIKHVDKDTGGSIPGSSDSKKKDLGQITANETIVSSKIPSRTNITFKAAPAGRPGPVPAISLTTPTVRVLMHWFRILFFSFSYNL